MAEAKISNEEIEEELKNAIHPNEDEIIDELLALSFQCGIGEKIKWKNAASKNGVVLDVTTDSCFKSFDLSSQTDTAGLQMIRGDTDVQDITPQIFYDWQEGFQDSHVIWEKEFEKTCTESKVTKYIDMDHCIGYTAYNPGYFVSPRDFCYMKTRRFYKNYKINGGPNDGDIYEECSIGLYYDILKDNKY